MNIGAAFRIEPDHVSALPLSAPPLPAAVAVVPQPQEETSCFSLLIEKIKEIWQRIVEFFCGASEPLPVNAGVAVPAPIAAPIALPRRDSMPTLGVAEMAALLTPAASKEPPLQERLKMWVPADVLMRYAEEMMTYQARGELYRELGKSAWFAWSYGETTTRANPRALMKALVQTPQFRALLHVKGVATETFLKMPDEIDAEYAKQFPQGTAELLDDKVAILRGSASSSVSS